jgi:hypothetical protein
VHAFYGLKLRKENIPDSLVSIYVVAEEESLYRTVLSDFGGKIIVGVRGLPEQRNFIQRNRI